ncbi:c-type cytochrome [Methylocaldum szegediense]|uniref:c-type cytochrome n=1 Tax=Methylocaldum szegediense TaxID=73780 RepID=UPI0012EBB275|nr:c-type cytochrome [Methylocaldum szegediense]
MVSAYVTALTTPVPQGVSADDRASSAFAQIALACTGCHGTSGQGVGSIPAINNIPESTFIRTMQEFKSGQRAATVMDRIAQGYNDRDFLELARFFRDRR